MEYNDIYDENRRPTGRLHRRGTRWHKGEFGLVVCVWVYDGKGNLLLTRRAPQKSFAGTWENSGGAAKAGETSRQAIARELYEETGIKARQERFRRVHEKRFFSLYRDNFKNASIRTYVGYPKFIFWFWANCAHGAWLPVGGTGRR